MSYVDPTNHIQKLEEVDFIVPERLREACTCRGFNYEKAALMCDMDAHEFGLMANGHREIPKELIFKFISGLGFPERFFYKVRWERV